MIMYCKRHSVLQASGVQDGNGSVLWPCQISRESDVLLRLQVPVPIHPSNVQITKLKLDKDRKDLLERKKVRCWPLLCFFQCACLFQCARPLSPNSETYLVCAWIAHHQGFNFCCYLHLRILTSFSFAGWPCWGRQGQGQGKDQAVGRGYAGCRLSCYTYPLLVVNRATGLAGTCCISLFGTGLWGVDS